MIQKQRCPSDQEDVSLHGGRVPGSEFEQTALPDQLVGRVDHLLVAHHLVDLQHPLEALLQKKDRAGGKTEVMPFLLHVLLGPFQTSEESNDPWGFGSSLKVKPAPHGVKKVFHFPSVAVRKQLTRASMLFWLNKHPKEPRRSRPSERANVRYKGGEYDFDQEWRVTYGFLNGAVGVGGCHGDGLQGLCSRRQKMLHSALATMARMRR